jgi:hypothetical protein
MQFNMPEEYAEEYTDAGTAAFQLGVCLSLIEQTIRGTLSVSDLAKRFTNYYPEWRNND